MDSKKPKRTLPQTGIYDPNYSQDPQYGNVSTLPDGTKRVHTYFRDKVKPDDYYRIQILFPECTPPLIDSSRIGEIDEINVPIIKNFSVEITEESNLWDSFLANVIIGISEKDTLSLGPFPAIKEFAPDQTLPQSNPEAIMILNNPIAYFTYAHSEKHAVSNIPNPKRGWICLQNYVNLFIATRDTDQTKFLSFNAYVDYDWCKMKYKDALIWRADFEKNLNYNLKYRLYHSGDQTLILSRGDVAIHESNDPSKFPPFVNNKQVYKIPERSLAAAISPREVLWGETLKKYMS